MCRLRSGWGQRLRRSGGWRATGQDFRGAAGGATHLTTFLRLALSRLLSWFEFFSPFPSSSCHLPICIRHKTSSHGHGHWRRAGWEKETRLWGGWGHFWTESDEHGVPGVYLVQGWGWGPPRQPVILLVPSEGVLPPGVQGPFLSLGVSQALPEASSGVFGPFVPSGPRIAAPGHPSPRVLLGPPASSSSCALVHLGLGDHRT